ncbi:DNA topoisomerase 4 subunit B [Novipirellula galeiformis]|uniref:DNA topoisomerase (ATP-hydrolyzing) n=1 Tax=Novipirellula galeiformis TaxID=2528004 RepID=A0A5C6BZL2_9BACT|nr:toprim domain-containing protein [Novipirellula galeiformis]TWU17693.1 DNA topoisomerase 4 subunit B [Novipirellula galeiformis]
MFPRQPIKLYDCRDHGVGSGAELFLVEGDSASRSVARARDTAFQAVLPMQGKPMNALKSTRRTIERNELYLALIDALGSGIEDYFHVNAMRYDRIILLFDPDADGIHCGALMMMFFYRWMRPLLESGRVSIVRAPMFEISATRYKDTLLAYGEEHYRIIREQLDAQGIQGIKINRFRGLASLNEATLRRTCLGPETRAASEVGLADAEEAIRVFSPNFR